MHITFSNCAVERLSPYLSDGTKQLKLLHDTEGCGCVVSGVPALQLIMESSVDDKLAHGEPFPFYYEPRHEVYYEPRLRVDYDPQRSCFSLKSDSQIYTLHLRFLS
ncbi:iron-sulfur cluster biosynthesis family protein [Paenibacillus alkaliterrae]|uniref:iron-sulfur cluster biosynthesis family protein n=1 Tax=Paenibacillus alkaliterrae TaxID=320909 RepID=UPI001F200FCD|nr:iron-sulfur cluster biosynthesis family protein [Paenibacillus alkaliterrae]MCF2938326.1 iron-sulfur cluster biosynthesis family protein [Paenibacillus alkaliterrae]